MVTSTLYDAPTVEGILESFARALRPVWILGGAYITEFGRGNGMGHREAVGRA